MTDNNFSELRKISQIKPMDLSAAKAYQDLEAKTANIYMLSGMTLDDIVYHLMKGDVFVSLDLINRQKAEIERLLTEFTRLKEETAQPYLLINTDAESTAEIIRTIKTQKALFVPGNEGTVEIFDKASIKAEAVKEFAERLKEMGECYQTEKGKIDYVFYADDFE